MVGVSSIQDDEIVENEEEIGDLYNSWILHSIYFNSVDWLRGKNVFDTNPLLFVTFKKCVQWSISVSMNLGCLLYPHCLLFCLLFFLASHLFFFFFLRILTLLNIQPWAPLPQIVFFEFWPANVLTDLRLPFCDAGSGAWRFEMDKAAPSCLKINKCSRLVTEHCR